MSRSNALTLYWQTERAAHNAQLSKCFKAEKYYSLINKPRRAASGHFCVYVNIQIRFMSGIKIALHKKWNANLSAQTLRCIGIKKWWRSFLFSFAVFREAVSIFFISRQSFSIDSPWDSSMYSVRINNLSQYSVPAVSFSDIWSLAVKSAVLML